MDRKHRSKKQEYLESGVPALVGRQIKKRRKEKGFTLRDLASEAGVSASTILRCEEGTCETNKRLIAKLAELLGCEVSELYMDDYEETMVVKRTLTPAQRKMLTLSEDYGDEVLDMAYKFIRSLKEK